MPARWFARLAAGQFQPAVKGFLISASREWSQIISNPLVQLLTSCPCREHVIICLACIREDGPLIFISVHITMSLRIQTNKAVHAIIFIEGIGYIDIIVIKFTEGIIQSPI